MRIRYYLAMPPQVTLQAMHLAVLLAVMLSLAGAPAFAHPGSVDRNGCHTEAKSAKQHCHSERKRSPLGSRYHPTNPPRAGDEGVFDGLVIWVTDGDSMRVLVKGRDMEVRLADIDAPEREQPYAWNSKLELIDLVRDRHVVLVPRDVDQYGRVVAYVWLDNLDVNRELVKRGAAWFYPEYAEDESLYDVEKDARAANRGLWARPAKERMEPWEWRRRKR